MLQAHLDVCVIMQKVCDRWNWEVKESMTTHETKTRLKLLIFLSIWELITGLGLWGFVSLSTSQPVSVYVFALNWIKTFKRTNCQQLKEIIISPTCPRSTRLAENNWKECSTQKRIKRRVKQIYMILKMMNGISININSNSRMRLMIGSWICAHLN